MSRHVTGADLNEGSAAVEDDEAVVEHEDGVLARLDGIHTVAPARVRRRWARGRGEGRGIHEQDEGIRHGRPYGCVATPMAPSPLADVPAYHILVPAASSSTQAALRASPSQDSAGPGASASRFSVHSIPSRDWA